MPNTLTGLMGSVLRDMDADDRRAKATPRVLWQAWPRPLHIGPIHAGDLCISPRPSTGEYELCFGARSTTARMPHRTDWERIEEAEREVAEAQARRDKILKAAWKRATPLSVDELAAMGAEDHRKPK